MGNFTLKRVFCLNYYILISLTQKQQRIEAQTWQGTHGFCLEAPWGPVGSPEGASPAPGHVRCWGVWKSPTRCCTGHPSNRSFSTQKGTKRQSPACAAGRGRWVLSPPRTLRCLQARGCRGGGRGRAVRLARLQCPPVGTAPPARSSVPKSAGTRVLPPPKTHRGARGDTELAQGAALNGSGCPQHPPRQKFSLKKRKPKRSQCARMTLANAGEPQKKTCTFPFLSSATLPNT